jgi:dihydroorotate dehydrogenase electron transfer subunit
LNLISAPVTAISEIMPGVCQIWLKAAPAAAEAAPGRYVMVRCGNDTVLPRPFSIHQCNENKIALLVRVIGKGTEWLSYRNPGDELEIFGPFGRGFSISPESKKLLLVAGGIGIAPLLFLLRQGLRQGYQIRLLLGAATARQLYPMHSLPGGIELGIATEDGSTGEKGMVTELLAGSSGRADQIFACGPLPMYRAMSGMPELKNRPVQVSMEVVMGCGRGICYGCTIKTKKGLKKVCQDGPVFDLADIIWEQGSRP